MGKIWEYAKCKQKVAELEAKLLSLSISIAPIGTIDINETASILLDKIEELGDDKSELYLADKNCPIFNERDVRDYLSLDETSGIVYVPEIMDCDDFAAKLFGKGFGLVWTTLHALNWFINESKEVKFVEPQTDQISSNLENWQGWDIRFFMSR